MNIELDECKDMCPPVSHGSILSPGEGCLRLTSQVFNIAKKIRQEEREEIRVGRMAWHGRTGPVNGRVEKCRGCICILLNKISGDLRRVL